MAMMMLIFKRQIRMGTAMSIFMPIDQMNIIAGNQNDTKQYQKLYCNILPQFTHWPHLEEYTNLRIKPLLSGINSQRKILMSGRLLRKQTRINL